MTGTEIRNALSGTAGLGVLFAISVVITLARPRVSRDPAVRRRASLLIGAAIVGQCMHFAEELGAGFYFRFPVLLGLSPWGA